MFGFHIANEIDYSRTFPLIVFSNLERKAPPARKYGELYNEKCGLGVRERDSGFPRKKSENGTVGELRK